MIKRLTIFLLFRKPQIEKNIVANDNKDIK